MSRRHQIAFIKQGGFSHINAAVEAQLRKQFPSHEQLVIDVAKEFLSRRLVRLMSRLHVWRHYGGDLLARRRTYWDCQYRTPWMAQAIRSWLGERLANHQSSLAFTFQTQSLFNASLPGIPHFLYTDHTHLANLTYPGFDPKLLFPELWLKLERKIYQDAAVNFTMSRHVEKSMIEQYGCTPDQVRRVFAGGNAPIVPCETSIARYSRKRILFNGVDWERKGGPELAAAFKVVSQKYPDATLVILGCSPNLDLPNCEVKGRVPLAEVSRHYAEASLFCLPTKNEPFGIVFVEAMQHGLPIVATRIGALPDMVEDGRNGWLVPSGETGPLAESICKLLDSADDCARFGAASLALARERYTWDAVGVKIQTAIQKVVRFE